MCPKPQPNKTGCRLKCRPDVRTGRNLRTRNEAGFTLLELIVSLTILSLVMVILFVSMETGIKSWEKGERETERYQELRTILELVPGQIKSIYPYILKEEGSDTPAFRGETDSVRFLSTQGAIPKGSSGLVFVSYFVDREGLKLYEKSSYKKEMFENAWDLQKDSILISRRVTGLSFEYCNDEGSWTKDWDVQKTLGFPRQLRMTLNYTEAGSQKEQTYKLVVPIMANSPL